jgi:hypothetical protein
MEVDYNQIPELLDVGEADDKDDDEGEDKDEMLRLKVKATGPAKRYNNSVRRANVYSTISIIQTRT